MAFWGVEVKPNKPYSHHSTSGTRLRVSQATLGNGISPNKCSLQCTVPGKTPVLLCSLFPDKAESCSLNLEFDQGDNHITFSVIGPRSVHIAGYYLPFHKSSQHNDDDDDTDSYGEDIGESDMESDLDGEEEDDDDYEDDFIDDGDLNQSSPSKETLEISDDEKHLYVNAGRKRLNKKYQASDSDGDSKQDAILGGERKRLIKKYQVTDSDGNSKQDAILGGGRSIFLSDSEDEDALPISSFSKAKDENAQEQEKFDKIATKKSMKFEFVNDEVIGVKRKLPYVQEGETESEVEKGGEENVEKRKKKKRKKEKKVTSNEEEKADDSLPSSGNRGSEVEKAVESHVGGEENVDKTKKKKKKKRKEEKEVTSNEEEKTVEIERLPSSNIRNVEEEAEEDGIERKKKKKKKKSAKSEDIEDAKAGKKISSPIGK